MGTQEAYTICNEVDQTMQRSIGVITKIDTIEEADGPLIVQKLRGQGNNAWKFNMGCVAIRNRTQAEIQANALCAEIEMREESFFQSHHHLGAVRPEMASEMLGFLALV